jgi:hypothetical protein
MNDDTNIVVDDVKTFILGGKSEFTILNQTSHVSYKYKVTQSRDDEKFFFIKVFDGQSYQYAGYLIMGDLITYGKGKKGTRDISDPAIKGLLWALRRGHRALPEPMVMYHHGRCACCGKTLDDPKSIIRGIGPVCWERVQKSIQIHISTEENP